MRIHVLGSEAEICGTKCSSSGNGSNFGLSTVRLVNTGSTDRLVSIENSSNSLIGTFTIKANGVEIVQKDSSDEIFS